MRLTSLVSLAGAAAVATLATLSISTSPDARAGGSADAGKALSTACQSCHGVSADVPHLAGQREAYIAKQLAAFKKGDRKDDLMSPIASKLTEDDIANVAAYWAAQANAGSEDAAKAATAAIRKSPMPFPKTFPTGYVVYTTENSAEQGIVAKSYVNNVGLAAAKAGKPLPDGSAVVVVNYEAKLGADKKPVLEKDGSWATGKILSYSAMESRAGWGKDIPALFRNGNWAYNLFTADKAPREFNHVKCLACHIPAASKSYVFGYDHIKDKASGK